MKNFLKFCFIITIAFFYRPAFAEGVVHLDVLNNGNVIYSDNISLPPEGNAEINDITQSPHLVNSQSVLNVVNLADQASENFNISNLIYYPSFGAFYLKCITVSGDELCDNWQYEVEGEDPGTGMDQQILTEGDSVTLFFGEKEKEPVIEPIPPEPEDPVVVKKRHEISGGYNPNFSTPAPEIKEPDPIALNVSSPSEDKSLILENQQPSVSTATPKIVQGKTAKSQPTISKKEPEAKPELVAKSVLDETLPVPPKQTSWWVNLIKWIFGL